MTSDTVGVMTATNGAQCFAGDFGMNSGSLSGQATSGFVQTLGYYPYQPAPVYYPVYTPYYISVSPAVEGRVAELEGEVKVLREMVAALVGKAAAKQRRKGGGQV